MIYPISKHFLPIFFTIQAQNNPLCPENWYLKAFYWKNLKMRRVFSTGKFDMIRVSQYLINGLKGGCKGHKYSKNLKKPLSSSTGMTSETLIYHNACNVIKNLLFLCLLKISKQQVVIFFERCIPLFIACHFSIKQGLKMS